VPSEKSCFGTTVEARRRDNGELIQKEHWGLLAVRGKRYCRTNKRFYHKRILTVNVIFLALCV
jgi:hypothetical protein